MRKKTIEYFFDNVMWYFLYLLPILLLTFSVFRTGDLITFGSLFNSLGLNFLTDNLILTTLTNIFGAGGVLPLFQTNDILIYLTYFVCVVIIHLFVDFLVFIPRLAHKWLNKFYGGD